MQERLFVCWYSEMIALNLNRDSSIFQLWGWPCSCGDQPAVSRPITLNSWPVLDSWASRVHWPVLIWWASKSEEGQRCLLCFLSRIYLWPGLLGASQRMCLDGVRLEGVDTNCRPFDISISTAGCAASHCEWKVALRRPEIRHAVGPLCPGSVLLLTQLPRGGRRAPRFPPCAGGTPPCTWRGAVNWHRCLPTATWPWAPLAAPWSQTPRKLFVFLTRKPPNSLLTGTSSLARSKTQGILRIAPSWDQGWIRIRKKPPVVGWVRVVQAGELVTCVPLPAIHFILLQNELAPLSGPTLLYLAWCPLPVCAAVVYCWLPGCQDWGGWLICSPASAQ